MYTIKNIQCVPSYENLKYDIYTSGACLKIFDSIYGVIEFGAKNGIPSLRGNNSEITDLTYF